MIVFGTYILGMVNVQGTSHLIAIFFHIVIEKVFRSVKPKQWEKLSRRAHRTVIAG